MTARETGKLLGDCPHLVLLGSILVQVGSELLDGPHRWYRPLPTVTSFLPLLLGVSVSWCHCLLRDN